MYKEGQIYSANDGDYIWECGKPGMTYYRYRICISSGMLATNSSHCHCYNRLATPQEKEHLLQCIAAGKFVEYVKPLNKIVYNYLIL